MLVRLYFENQTTKKVLIPYSKLNPDNIDQSLSDAIYETYTDCIYFDRVV